mgnify:CR=1 FL=1
MSGVNTIEDVMNVSNVESVVMQLCDRINMYKLNNIVASHSACDTIVCVIFPLPEPEPAYKQKQYSNALLNLTI